MKMLNDLNLSNIDVCYVPADKAYDMYLSNQMMNVGKLPLPASVTEG